MKRLVIAIDCDDVLIDTGEFIIRAYNHAHGTDLALEEYYSKDTTRWGADSIDEASSRMRQLLVDAGHQSNPPAIMTIQAVRRLAEQHELHLVTGRDDLFEPMTAALVDEFFSGCFTGIHHTNYYTGSNKRTKGQVCTSIGADVLIDDNIEHIQSVLDQGLEEVIVFGEYPWNRTDELPRGAVRCLDWVAASKEIDRIAGR